MKNLKIIAVIVFSAIIMFSCVSQQSGYQQSSGGEELTVGTVQKEIRKGMSGAEVVEILGSPNIVTKDEGDMETWVYDKIATEISYSESHDAIFLILGGISNASAQVKTTQKTLTVVIKFNDNNKVASFSYHASKF